MAKVWLTVSDCMSGNTPPRCVVCGSDDEVEYLDREMEYRPNWPLTFLGFHLVGMHLLGALLGLFAERSNQVIPTQLPYCCDHYGYWHQRDRREHLGILIIALGWLVPLLSSVVRFNHARLSPGAIWAGVACTAAGLACIYSLGFRKVHIAAVKKNRLLMADVDAGFQEAVETQP